jgi:uncharacterized protein (TIGR03437 family)
MKGSRPSWLLCFALLVPFAEAQAAVSIDDVVNAGSLIPTGLPGGGVAQGALFAVIGKGVGPDTAQQAGGFPLPAADGLAGVSVKVTVGDTSVDAIMVYVSTGEVIAILPSGTPLGSGTVTVNNNGDTASAPITVVASAAGLFTNNANGQGQALAFNVNAADGSTVRNSLSQPAQTGQNVILNGTGLGAITSDETQAGVMDVPSAAPVVFVGGVQAAVVSAGRGTCCSGIDPSFPILQGVAGWDTITITVPSGLQGCAVPVVVQTGGTVSNFPTIAIAAADGTCYDASSKYGTYLQTALGLSGVVKTGSISLSRIGLKLSVQGLALTSNSDSGSATFQQTDLSGGPVSSQQVAALVSQYGSCVVVQTRVPSLVPVVTGPLPVGLDAGDGINVKGPRGSKTMTKQDVGSYSANFGTSTSTNLPGGLPPIVNGTPFLDAGNYAIDNGSGGADIGAFNLNVTTPTPLSWDNQDQITTVDRAAGVTVKWSGGDPAGFVQIFGQSSIMLSKTASLSVAFYCTEKVSAGSFAVPGYVTSALPPASLNSQTNVGLLALYSATSAPVTIPNVDIGIFTSLSAAAKNVGYQ